jgi:hypothetical protein
MQKTGLLFLLTFFCLSFTTKAQQDTLTETKKNEFGFSVTPFVAAAIGDNNFTNKPINITYKRNFKKLTFRTTFEINDHSIEYMRYFNYNNYQNITDSSYSIFSQHGKSNQLTGRIGVEKRHYIKPKIQMVYGIDFFVAKKNTLFTYTLSDYEKTETHIDNKGYEYYTGNYISSTDAGFLSEQTRILGLSPTFGFLFEIKRKWYLSVINRTNYGWGSTNFELANYLNSTSIKHKSNTFEFFGNTIISEVSLYYRF